MAYTVSIYIDIDEVIGTYDPTSYLSMTIYSTLNGVNHFQHQKSGTTTVPSPQRQSCTAGKRGARYCGKVSCVRAGYYTSPSGGLRFGPSTDGGIGPCHPLP